MKLIFAGSGSAFTVGTDNFHSNMILESTLQHRLLIDCGSDARNSLSQLGLTYQDINHVFVSHLHADHAGGLEWLGLRRKFSPHCSRPKLYLEPDLRDLLWNNVLSGGMSCIENETASLDTFFDLQMIQNHCFMWEEISFHTVKAIHVYNNHQLLPSYGLFFTINRKKILITTDTQFQPDYYRSYFQEAHLIFQDCETAKEPSGVHAHYNELVNLDAEIKAKMWLYHYNSTELPDAKKAGFLGFVKKGQCFELS